MAAYTVRAGDLRGDLVAPLAVPPRLADVVERIQRAPWPQWLQPGARMRREVAELCRLQSARGLTVLAWLAEGDAPADIDWLLDTHRLTGRRQERMYGAAERLADPVRELVVANWTWALSTAHGGRVTAPFFASRAYPDDGYAAAHATVTLLQLWDRVPEVRQALALAWAATRTPADWCKAAELRAGHGDEVPIFTYPRGPLPPKSAVRPWIGRLLRCA
ncbi:hypothetical protein [Actinoallomurus soli]|uniref:hypothetical protein n=1 Tax=Actinoallomurus soli TaxID=2952535 RepID=UPI002093D6B5|nr:hypothetical protein [Actinoallomurus soli]MCO5968185.1 hypothetical protein [Actinoallomurus soli]